MWRTWNIVCKSRKPTACALLWHIRNLILIIQLMLVQCFPDLGLLPAPRFLLGASLISFTDFAQVENKSLFATTCPKSEASNGVIDPPQLATQRAGRVSLGFSSRTTRMARTERLCLLDAASFLHVMCMLLQACILLYFNRMVLILKPLSATYRGEPPLISHY